MNFEVTPEQQALVDSVRSVLEKECPTALVRDVVENGSVPDRPWKSARELGWTVAPVEELDQPVAGRLHLLGPRLVPARRERGQHHLDHPRPLQRLAGDHLEHRADPVGAFPRRGPPADDLLDGVGDLRERPRGGNRSRQRERARDRAQVGEAHADRDRPARQ